MGAEKDLKDMTAREVIDAVNKTKKDVTDIWEKIETLKTIWVVSNASELMSSDLLLALLYKWKSWEDQIKNWKLILWEVKDDRKEWVLKWEWRLLYDEYKRIFSSKTFTMDDKSFLFKENIDTKVLWFSNAEVSKDKPWILELLPDWIIVKLKPWTYKGSLNVKWNDIIIEPLSWNVTFVWSTLDEIREYVNSDPTRIAEFNKQKAERAKVMKEKNPQIIEWNKERKAWNKIQEYTEYSMEEYLWNHPILNVTWNWVEIRWCTFNTEWNPQLAVRIWWTTDKEWKNIEWWKDIKIVWNTFTWVQRGVVSMYAQNFNISWNTFNHPEEDWIFFWTFHPYWWIIEKNIIKMEDKIVNGQVIAHRDAIQWVPIDPNWKWRSQFQWAGGTWVKIKWNDLYLWSKTQWIFMIDWRLWNSEISWNNLTYSSSIPEDGSFKHLISIWWAEKSINISWNKFNWYQNPTLLLVPPRLLNTQNYSLENFQRKVNDPKAPFFVFMKDWEVSSWSYSIPSQQYKKSIEGGNTTNNWSEIKVITTWDEYLGRDKWKETNEAKQIDTSALTALEQAIFDAAQIKKTEEWFINSGGEVLNNPEKVANELTKLELKDLNEKTIISIWNEIVNHVYNTWNIESKIDTPLKSIIFQKYADLMREAWLREMTGITLSPDIAQARKTFEKLKEALSKLWTGKRNNLIQLEQIDLPAIQKEFSTKNDTMLFQMWVNMEWMKINIDWEQESLIGFINSNRIDLLKRFAGIYVQYLNAKKWNTNLSKAKEKLAKKQKLDSGDLYALAVENADLRLKALWNTTNSEVNFRKEIDSIFLNENEALWMWATSPNNALNTLVTQLQNKLLEFLISPKQMDKTFVEQFEKEFIDIFTEIYSIDTRSSPLDLWKSDWASAVLDWTQDSLEKELSKANDPEVQKIWEQLKNYLENLSNPNPQLLDFIKAWDEDWFRGVFSSVFYWQWESYKWVMSIFKDDLDKAFDLGVSMYKDEKWKERFKDSLKAEKADLEKKELNSDWQKRLENLNALLLYNWWNKKFEAVYEASVWTAVVIAMKNNAIYRILNDNSKVLEKQNLYFANLNSQINWAWSYIWTETQQELMNNATMLVMWLVTYWAWFSIAGIAQVWARNFIAENLWKQIASNFITKVWLRVWWWILASWIAQTWMNALSNWVDFEKWKLSINQFAVDILWMTLMEKLYLMKWMQFKDNASMLSQLWTTTNRTIAWTWIYTWLDVWIQEIWNLFWKNTEKYTLEQFVMGLAFWMAFERVFWKWSLQKAKLIVDKDWVLKIQDEKGTVYTIEELHALMKKWKVDDLPEWDAKEAYRKQVEEFNKIYAEVKNLKEQNVSWEQIMVKLMSIFKWNNKFYANPSLLTTQELKNLGSLWEQFARLTKPSDLSLEQACLTSGWDCHHSARFFKWVFDDLWYHNFIIWDKDVWHEENVVSINGEHFLVNPFGDSYWGDLYYKVIKEDIKNGYILLNWDYKVNIQIQNNKLYIIWNEKVSVTDNLLDNFRNDSIKIQIWKYRIALYSWRKVTFSVEKDWNKWIFHMESRQKEILKEFFVEENLNSIEMLAVLLHISWIDQWINISELNSLWSKIDSKEIYKTFDISKEINEWNILNEPKVKKVVEKYRRFFRLYEQAYIDDIKSMSNEDRLLIIDIYIKDKLFDNKIISDTFKLSQDEKSLINNLKAILFNAHNLWDSNEVLKQKIEMVDVALLNFEFNWKKLTKEAATSIRKDMMDRGILWWPKIKVLSLELQHQRLLSFINSQKKKLTDNINIFRDRSDWKWLENIIGEKILSLNSIDELHSLLNSVAQSGKGMDPVHFLKAKDEIIKLWTSINNKTIDLQELEAKLFPTEEDTLEDRSVFMPPIDKPEPPEPKNPQTPVDTNRGINRLEGLSSAESWVNIEQLSIYNKQLQGANTLAELNEIYWIVPNQYRGNTLRSIYANRKNTLVQKEKNSLDFKKWYSSVKVDITDYRIEHSLNSHMIWWGDSQGKGLYKISKVDYANEEESKNIINQQVTKFENLVRSWWKDIVDIYSLPLNISNRIDIWDYRIVFKREKKDLIMVMSVIPINRSRTPVK